MSLADDMAADAAAVGQGTTDNSKQPRLSLADQMKADAQASAAGPVAPGGTPAGQVAYSAIKPVTDRVGAFGSGANTGLTTLAGLPVDTVANVLDLGKAAIGAPYTALTGNTPAALQPYDRSQIPGTAAWIQNKIAQTPTGADMLNNNAQEHPYIHAAGMGTGMAAGGGTAALPDLLMAGGANAAAQYTTDKTGNPLYGQAVAAAIPGAAGMAQEARAASQASASAQPKTVQQQTLADAQNLGYKAPPSQAGGGTLSSLLEGMAGKAKVAQTASAQNQTVTNNLVAQDLGLPAGTQITPQVLQNIRNQAGQHYENVKQAGGTITADPQYQSDLAALSQRTQAVQQSFPNAKLAGVNDVADLARGLNEPNFTASAAVERVKQLRADARSVDPTDPASKALSQAQSQAADALDGVITRNLQAQGKGDLATNYINARTQIAKTHTVEDALNEGSGDVSLKSIANSGAPLTGNLKAAANFYSAFPKANQNVSTVGGIPHISPIDLYGSMAAGAAGGLATGSPIGVAAGLGVPLARYGALKGALANKGVSAPSQPYALSSLLAPTLATSDANRNR